jgi:hypothetical protein
MAANYPNTIKIWDPVVNLQDLVVAEDVNTVYEELEAVQRQLGAGGVATSAIWGSTGDVNTSTTNWGSLRARIQNIENGVFFAVSARGASVIQPSDVARVGLTIRAATGQTANLLEIRNSSNQIVANWAASGAFTGTIDGGTA